MAKNQPLRFREAKRTQQSFLANLEKKALLWLAARMPAWINSDHLTVLGLAAMAGAGVSYWWARSNRAGLLLAIICLAINWLGDSLDGTVARFRNCCRPRYGFYVDHVVDAFSALFLLGGLALSGYMSPWIALGLLIVYLMLSVEIYLASYARRLQNLVPQDEPHGTAPAALHRKHCPVMEIGGASGGTGVSDFRYRRHHGHFGNAADPVYFRGHKHRAIVSS